MGDKQQQTQFQRSRRRGLVAATIAFSWAVLVSLILLFVPLGGGEEPLIAIGGVASVVLLAIPVAMSGVGLAAGLVAPPYQFPMRLAAAILLALLSIVGIVTLLGMFFIPSAAAATVSAIQTGTRKRSVT